MSQEIKTLEEFKIQLKEFFQEHDTNYMTAIAEDAGKSYESVRLWFNNPRKSKAIEEAAYKHKVTVVQDIRRKEEILKMKP